MLDLGGGRDTLNPPRTRRELLRFATDALHRRLDAKFTPADFVERDRYARFLQCTARALLPLERALERSAVQYLFSDWPVRQRSTALTQDLRDLEASTGAVECDIELPLAQALGVLYVLEGSRLGSKVLLGYARTSDDSVLRAATRYLASNDSSLWRSFLATLESVGRSGEQSALDDAALIEGAQFAFECYLVAYQSVD